MYRLRAAPMADVKVHATAEHTRLMQVASLVCVVILLVIKQRLALVSRHALVGCASEPRTNVPAR
jgi:hypothetical protein